MKPERFKRTKSVAAASAIALVVAALVMGVSSLMLGSTQSPKFALTSGSGFTINSGNGNTISSSPTSLIPAKLDPGVQRYLWYAVDNALSIPITVNSLSISGVTPPAGCATSNLDLSHTTFSGSLVVPKKVGLVDGTNAVSVPISLINGPSLPNTCKNASFTFSFIGSATYTEIYATSTAVTSSLNPSTVGQSITYTATVTASAGASQDQVPSSPTGSVTFYDGTVIPAHVIAGCSGVAVASATTTTAKATCLSPVYGTTGTHSITAVYTNTDGNFTGSTSPVFTQTVNLATATLAFTSAPNPSTFGQSVTFSAQTTPASGPTGTVNFYSCTTAACTSTFLLGTGPLNATGKATFATSALPGGTDYLGAVYGGDTHYATATSNVVTQTVNYTTPCIVTTINGGYTVKSGQSICISSPGRVNGGVTVQSGGSLVLNGANINGNITATSANALRFCGSTVNGNITATGTTGYIVIGDGGDDGPPGCAANSITGNLTLTSGTGGFEFAGNTVTGTATLTGNTGSGPTSEDASPEVEGNKITGALSCATSNSPAITDGGQKNTVTGTKSGQSAGSGF